MKDVGNHRHQPVVLINLKNNISKYQVVFHMDYQKKLLLTLNTQSKSFQFGYSRKQVTLHARMMYYKTIDKYV